MYVVLGQGELCDCIYMFVFLELNSAIFSRYFNEG